MCRHSYTRKFLGKNDSHLAAFSAVGGKFPWCEFSRGDRSLCVDDADEAEQMAAFLLAWARAARKASAMLAAREGGAK